MKSNNFNKMLAAAIDKKALKKAWSDPKARKEITNILNKVRI